MTDNKLLGAGIAAALIAALCCAAPALALLFGTVGLTTGFARSGYVILPVLVAVIGCAIYLSIRHHQRRQN